MVRDHGPAVLEQGGITRDSPRTKERRLSAVVREGGRLFTRPEIFMRRLSVRARLYCSFLPPASTLCGSGRTASNPGATQFVIAPPELACALRAEELQQMSASGHAGRAMPRLLNYLARLTPGRIILWCYAIWYAVSVVHHFDARPR